MDRIHFLFSDKHRTTNSWHEILTLHWQPYHLMLQRKKSNKECVAFRYFNKTIKQVHMM